jgi:ribosomal-protein-alanine N-acetyltransferase
VIIRALRTTDLPVVVQLEQTTMVDPWNEAQLAEELEAVNGVSLVAEQDGLVCGYALFRTCTPESELLRLAVAPEWRRQGVGKGLLEYALRSFAGQGYTSCFLEVRASNVEARRLYAQAGFAQIGIRKKYYHQPVEDALQLCRNLIDFRGGNS